MTSCIYYNYESDTGFKTCGADINVNTNGCDCDCDCEHFTDNNHVCGYDCPHWIDEHGEDVDCDESCPRYYSIVDAKADAKNQDNGRY